MSSGESSKIKTDPEKMKIILATDCGSTTSKARLFKKLGDEYRFVASGEAPTTVEAPFEDVTIGVCNAIQEVEDLAGIKLLEGNRIIEPTRGENEGVDLYVTTSSAGGGLQMMVAGVVGVMTAESARRAALGAGGIVVDIVSIDDGRQPYEKIERMRSLRPDMILLAGGTDGGTVYHVVQIAELVSVADPKPRLGALYKLPIIYAGNVEARGEVRRLLDRKEIDLREVDNLRPVLEIENIEPSREAIHELFMEHVMSHAPGYDKLMKWTPVPIMPTPAGEGMMFQLIAKTYGVNTIGVGLGGATTNVYSIYEGKFVRTVSANLGMSYSICNVLKEAGLENIMRWIPLDVDECDVRNRLHNKMIRPTTIPQTLDDLMIEHAIAREALRLGFKHHKLLARPLRGAIRAQRDISDTFESKTYIETYIDMLKVGWVGGTGGLLSHAPRRAQSALCLIDGFQPEGVTKLVQDSVFMMPHLGVLSTVHPKAAIEIFEKDCLVRVGTCIAPRGVGEEGKEVLKIKAKMPDGSTVSENVSSGMIKRIPLEERQTVTMTIDLARGFDLGRGLGHRITADIEGGVVGIIIDARGRPLTLPTDDEERKQKLIEWFRAIDAYPETIYELSKG